jgi:hypothetical protein
VEGLERVGGPVAPRDLHGHRVQVVEAAGDVLLLQKLVEPLLVVPLELPPPVPEALGRDLLLLALASGRRLVGDDQSPGEA